MVWQFGPHNVPCFPRPSPSWPSEAGGGGSISVVDIMLMHARTTSPLPQAQACGKLQPILARPFPPTPPGFCFLLKVVRASLLVNQRSDLKALGGGGSGPKRTEWAAWLRRGRSTGTPSRQLRLSEVEVVGWRAEVHPRIGRAACAAAALHRVLLWACTGQGYSAMVALCWRTCIDPGGGSNTYPGGG